MILDAIEKTKAKLSEQNVIPRWIKLSPKAHEALIEELHMRDGRRHARIFEIMGLAVQIDEECPPGGAYMGGNE